MRCLRYHLKFLIVNFAFVITRLGDHGRSSCALVSPSTGQNTNRLVVSAKTVDSGFDKNETELAVLVFSVALEVLSDGDSLIRY